MELSQIKCFLAVAETLNFTRAAERLGIGQPSLSRALRRLEVELGGPLIRRERGNTHLTDLGRTVLPRLSVVLSEAQAALSDATTLAATSRVSLRLGVMCTIGPARIVSLFRHLAVRLPRFELIVRNDTAERLTAMLLAGEVDVAVLAAPKLGEHLEALRLYEEPYVIAFPRGHRFERLAEVPLSELRAEAYLDRLNCEYLSYVEAEGRVWDLDLDVRVQSEHEDWIQAMVATGMGCCVIPAHLVAHSDILTRPLVDPALSRTVSLVTVRGRPRAALVEQFCRLCRTVKWDTAGATDGVGLHAIGPNGVGSRRNGGAVAGRAR